MEYHAHVYWSDSKHRQLAYNLRATFIQLGCLVGVMHDVAVGPHSLPQYQVRFSDEHKQKIEILLRLRAKELSALIHESTKDDVRDHTEGASWIGKELPLNLEWLENNTHRDERRKL